MISIVLTGPDTVIVGTDSDGSYTLPMLEDGLWPVVIWFPYYLPVTDTLQIANGRVMPSLGDRMLVQALQFQTITDRTTYTLGDTIYISALIRNPTTAPVTVVSSHDPASFYMIRQGSQTIIHSGNLHPTVTSKTFQPGESIGVPWVWLPGEIPDATPIPPGTYTVFGLWLAPMPVGFTAENYFDLGFFYFAFSPESDPAAEALLRTVSSVQITLMAPSP